MEVIRGRERDCRQEVGSAVEHGGTRQLDELIRKGILLKADVSELGEGWSDSRIAAALDTSIATAGHPN
jgi:hypothetical protein